MAEKDTKSEGEIKEVETAAEQPLLHEESAGGGGWGGWGFSPFSYLTDLQKAAAVAAEEISRNVCTNSIGLISENFSVFAPKIRACLIAYIICPS